MPLCCTFNFHNPVSASCGEVHGGWWLWHMHTSFHEAQYQETATLTASVSVLFVQADGRLRWILDKVGERCLKFQHLYGKQIATVLLQVFRFPAGLRRMRSSAWSTSQDWYRDLNAMLPDQLVKQGMALPWFWERHRIPCCGNEPRLTTQDSLHLKL